MYDVVNEPVQMASRQVDKVDRTNDTAFEYTPENIERIDDMMAAEAERALQDDSNAIIGPQLKAANQSWLW